MAAAPGLSQRGRQRTRQPLEALGHPLARRRGAALHVVSARAARPPNRSRGGSEARSRGRAALSGVPGSARGTPGPQLRSVVPGALERRRRGGPRQEAERGVRRPGQEGDSGDV